LLGAESKKSSVFSLRKAHKFRTIPSEFFTTLDASEAMSGGSMVAQWAWSLNPCTQMGAGFG
jgi:hypothetical protein